MMHFDGEMDAITSLRPLRVGFGKVSKRCTCVQMSQSYYMIILTVVLRAPKFKGFKYIELVSNWAELVRLNDKKNIAFFFFFLISTQGE